MKLHLCVSQQTNEVHPYRFSATGIQVYSFEEVMYHVYHHWKQSVDDFVSPGLAAWVHDSLGLSLIAAKMKEIARIESFSEQMLSFLEIIEYFDESDLTAILPHLQHWEKRLEWETYKERADDLMRRGEPGKAIALYRRALQFDENVPILNNLGVACMQTEAYGEACRYLQSALKIDGKCIDLMKHYTEALIAARRFDDSLQTLERVARLVGPSDADILYLRGELALGMGDSNKAISYFEQAIAISPQEHYMFRLSDVYASRRQFEKALEAVGRKSISTGQHSAVTALMKEADLHQLAGDMPSAVSAICKAAEIKPSHTELWVRLARYHRLNYDLSKAAEAIEKALSLDSSNERAILESARIQKNMGHTKVYQQQLKGVLAGFKSRYRE